MPVAETVD
jgi:hypothetical protein